MRQGDFIARLLAGEPAPHGWVAVWAYEGGALERPGVRYLTRSGRWSACKGWMPIDVDAGDLLYASADLVALADGLAIQERLHGVEAVSPSRAKLEAYRRAKAAKRRHEPMREGDLFDDVARNQQELF